MTDRIKRINSLLKEVIAEVIKRDVRHPKVNPLLTINKVDASKDLRHAKVYVGVIGTEEERKETVKALQSAARFIAAVAAKKIIIRYFPELRFYVDASVDEHMRIDTILRKIEEEQESREIQD